MQGDAAGLQEQQYKRRRWAQEQRLAIGSPLAIATASSRAVPGAMDLLSFVRGSSQQQLARGLIASADFAVVTGQLAGESLEVPSGRALMQQQRLAWAWACPLTGTGWTRAV